MGYAELCQRLKCFTQWSLPGTERNSLGDKIKKQLTAVEDEISEFEQELADREAEYRDRMTAVSDTGGTDESRVEDRMDRLELEFELTQLLYETERLRHHHDFLTLLSCLGHQTLRLITQENEEIPPLVSQLETPIKDSPQTVHGILERRSQLNWISYEGRLQPVPIPSCCPVSLEDFKIHPSIDQSDGSDERVVRAVNAVIDTGDFPDLDALLQDRFKLITNSIDREVLNQCEQLVVDDIKTGSSGARNIAVVAAYRIF